MYVVVNKRWKVFIGFLMTLIILVTASILSYQGWFIPYSRGFLTDWYRSGTLTFGHVMTGWFSGTGVSIGFWIAWLLGFVVFMEWLGSLTAPLRRVMWTVCLSLAATPLMGFPIFESNHVVLLPGMIFFLMLVWERWKKRRRLLFGSFVLLAIVIPYTVYAQFMNTGAPVYLDVLRIIPPVLTILGLYWMRWWMLRHPPMWADELAGKT